MVRGMVRGNRYVAAGLAAGLALSALATPSFAQRAEGDMSGQREKALRDCSGEGGENEPVHLGGPADPQTPLLHDAAWRTGVTRTSNFPVSAGCTDACRVPADIARQPCGKRRARSSPFQSLTEPASCFGVGRSEGPFHRGTASRFSETGPDHAPAYGPDSRTEE
jgi:hypothetical protein